ncbi:EsaB/YukD family protein [Microlunatus sp. Gsoil 973]|uniref:EsaB/YukD family protein n=1 Tax=Microlunatus sp. Gsoil 973 TaxID=2672569 RepID=UPI0012B502DF|nr:EsaB/YukD family protein [Microlunatus sp. Gsoil 973]QGN34633.1 hypothetical protein GJV80_19385 [Microlunatus sp. Gsoil 973]
MTDFTRLTVIGTLRRAELVVPDDEPLGGLLPRLLDLLDEPAGPAARPLTVVRTTGEQLDAALSAAQQRLLDGEILRLVRADEAPPPPEVADVTDVVGSTFADRRGRWTSATRHVVAAAAVGVLLCAADLVRPVSATVAGIAVLVLIAAAVLTGRLGRRWPATVLTSAAVGLTVAAVHSAAPAADLLGRTPYFRLGPGAVTAAAVWLVLGLGFGAGLRNRSAGPAAALGAVLAILPVALAGLGMPAAHALAVDAVLAGIGCGLLPWYALTASGLTGLDDQVMSGRPGRRGQVLRTVDDAYRSLTWSTWAVAAPLAVAPAVLIPATDRWTAGLGLALLVLTALRTRVFPLAVQRIPLWAAVLVVAITAIVTHQTVLGTGGSVAALALLAALVAVSAGVEPAAHQRARLRRWGNLLEAVSVIALPVLLLGAFGIFSDLLGAFR